MNDLGTLSHPYYTYPGIPCCGYSNFYKYNIELLRLQKMFETLSSYSDSIIFHLTIGAAMEEYNKIIGESYEFQWQQLFPYHIRRFIKENPKRENKIIHFIVSPNEHFEKSNDIPFFIQKTPDFEWKITDRSYYSKKFNYEVHIFYTMMPAVDTRNEAILSQLEKLHFPEDKLNSYRQTQFDRNFTKNFYHSINTSIGALISKGGVATCFSFAVFNADSDRAKIKDYVMFPEIAKIFCDHGCILAEWIFRLTCYVVVLQKSSPSVKLSYVEPTKNTPDGIQITINYEDSRFVINFENLNFH